MKEPYSNDCVALELIRSMINMEMPNERPTAENILNNPFFKDYYGPTLPIGKKTIINEDITNNISELKGIM